MDEKKCAHPASQCIVTKDSEYGNYSSEHCKEAGDLAEIECECGRPACNAETMKLE